MNHRLSRNVLVASSVTATIDLVIGLAFLLGPELGITLWTSPISSVLMRFIGSIIVANGISYSQLQRPRPRPFYCAQYNDGGDGNFFGLLDDFAFYGLPTHSVAVSADQVYTSPVWNWEE